MARVIDLRDGRPSGALHWLKVAAAVGLAVALGLGAAWWIGRANDGSQRTAAAAAGPSTAMAISTSTPAGAEPVSSPAAPTAPTAPATLCAAPMQTLQLRLGTEAPLPVCAGRTQVRQSGSVRSFIAQDGGRAWVLQIDTAGGEVVKASLRARDGRRFVCDGRGCRGIQLLTHDALGTRAIELRQAALTLAEEPTPRARPATTPAVREARVSASLTVASSEPMPDLACTGPALTISAPDGLRQNFCAQGGAGFEIADDGSRTYQFQDFEGRTLAVRLDPQQTVTRVRFGRHACEGAACRGVTVSAAQPDNDLAERSFFFGRTALTDTQAATGAADAPPSLQLDGSLVLPAQS